MVIITTTIWCQKDKNKDMDKDKDKDQDKQKVGSGESYIVEAHSSEACDGGSSGRSVGVRVCSTCTCGGVSPEEVTRVLTFLHWARVNVNLRQVWV